MFKRRPAYPTSSLKTAVLFISIVIVVLFVAIGVKFVQTVQKSVFDGQHQFIILFQTSQHNGALVAINPSTPSLNALYITNPKHENIQTAIPLGADAILQTNSSLHTVQDIQHALFANISIMSSGQSHITWYDLLRLYFIAKTVNPANITEDNITLPADATDLSTAEKLFTDPELVKESIPIQVINASDISGKATRLEILLSNTGCSIIDVRTSPQTVDKSGINYYGTMSYTVEKLHHILGYPVHKTHQQMIGEIQIIIGEDSNHFVQF